jgi:hypothetical protein
MNITGSASAEDLEKLVPMIGKDFKDKTEQDLKEKLLKETITARHEDTQTKRMGQISDKEVAAEAKKTAAEKNEFDRLTTILNSSRQLPEVKQAHLDNYNIDKALKNISQFKDPNKMTSEDLHLLYSEIGKVATGGVPTNEQIKGLDPDTFQKRFAKVWQKFSNDRTPANAGSFIKQYQSYLKDLKNHANTVIDSNAGSLIESSKHLLGERNYNALKKAYVHSVEEAKPNNSKTLSKTDVKEYAGLHKISPEEANTIFNKAGYTIEN